MSDNDTRPPTKPRFNVQTRLRSFVYAGRGLRSLAQDEHNAWLHLAITVVVVIAGFVLNLTLEDWRWLIVAIAIVWTAEAINTAVEELCDRVSPDFDPAIGRVKDLAASGVLVASLSAAAIGLLTLGPPLLDLLGFLR